MATSSIFANFNITDSKKAESFVTALDNSAKEKNKKPCANKNSFVVLPDDIKSLWAKRKSK
ncbi:hypothetical protein [Treponema sp.]|uniref:hypothetical protein n=1 Tax=Treponema sp. TaxID=166 RepID=UPI003F0B3AF7